MLRRKNWIQLDYEIGIKRYMNFLKSLWYGMNSGLNKLVVFRNTKNGKEVLKIGKMTFKAKIKKKKKEL